MPGYLYAEETYLFIENAKKTDHDEVLTKLINKGDEDAKQELKTELKKRYGNLTDTFINTAIIMAMETKDNKTEEDLVKIFIKT